jgi:hypothetical protein
MVVDNRRMCDRCGEEIEKGDDYYYYNEKSQELCAHCVVVEMTDCGDCMDCSMCG